MMVNKKAFTLIELLVVISIIALLLSVMLPSLNRARIAASRVVCQSNLRQYTYALQMYSGDHGGRFVKGGGDGIDVTVQWLHALWPYIQSTDVAMCPRATRISEGGNIPHGPEAIQFAWVTTLEGRRFTSSYGINEWIQPVDPRHTQLFQKHWPRLDGISGADQVPTFADCVSPGGWPEPHHVPPAYIGDTGIAETPPQQMKRFVIPRHGNDTNVAFLDHSVRRVELKELWQLKWHQTFNTRGPWTRHSRFTPDWPEWMRSLPDPE